MADGGAMWAQMNGGPADPIGSFTAGANLAAKMDSIRQATQAASFNSTLQILKMQDAKADRAERLMVANRELELSAFNAETNRINALRPLRGSTGYGSGSGSLQNLIQLPDGSMGVDLGPADGSGNVPQGTIPADDVNNPQGATDELGMTPLGASSDMPQQMPTSGEGDMSGPPMSQRVPQNGGLTMPIQGENNGGNPLLPSPTGAPANPASAGEVVNINGRMVRRLPPNTSITQKGPGFSMTTRTPTTAKPKEVPQQDWDTMGKLMKLGGLELTGVDGFDANGRPQPKFEKPKVKDEKALYDFDQLDEETRAKITDSFKRVAFPVPPEGFSDVEKMAAVGIQLPPDADPSAIEAAGAKMTPELWTRGYNILKEKALANREQAVMEHSALLTSVAGKRVTPEEVIKMLPEYTPPADTRQGNVGTTMQKMTETGDSVGSMPAAGAGTPEAPAVPKLTPEERRAIGTKAQAARVRFAHSGMQDTAADAEARALQKQLDDDGAAPSRAASSAAPAAAAPQAESKPFSGKIPTIGEAAAQAEEEKQRPLKEQDNKQWNDAKEKAIEVIERVAKKKGLRPETILATIARQGVTDGAIMAGIQNEPEWTQGTMFRRQSSTPGMNGVSMAQVLEALVQDEGLLKKKYGITLDQLRPEGAKPPLQVTSVKAK